MYRSGQLIHSDPEDYNLVYVNRGNGAEAVAHFKMAPTHARYYGFGEKAGATLDNQYASMASMLEAVRKLVPP